MDQDGERQTVTRPLSEEQLARYQPWFDNARRLQDLLAKLEIASLHAVTEAQAEYKKEEARAEPNPKDRQMRLRLVEAD